MIRVQLVILLPGVRLMSRIHSDNILSVVGATPVDRGLTHIWVFSPEEVHDS